jgi:tetratricopeptide (TPR) repeat protein
LDKIYALNPDDKSAQRERYSNLVFVGNLYLNILGNVDKSLELYQQALTISEQIARQDPQNSQAQRDLLVSYGKLGSLYKQLKQNQQALPFFNQALPIAEKLAEDKFNQQAQQDLKWVQDELKALGKSK